MLYCIMQRMDKHWGCNFRYGLLLKIGAAAVVLVSVLVLVWHPIDIQRLLSSDAIINLLFPTIALSNTTIDESIYYSSNIYWQTRQKFYTPAIRIDIDQIWSRQYFASTWTIFGSCFFSTIFVLLFFRVVWTFDIHFICRVLLTVPLLGR